MVELVIAWDSALLGAGPEIGATMPGPSTQDRRRQTKATEPLGMTETLALLVFLLGSLGMIALCARPQRARATAAPRRIARKR